MVCHCMQMTRENGVNVDVCSFPPTNSNAEVGMLYESRTVGLGIKIQIVSWRALVAP